MDHVCSNPACDGYDGKGVVNEEAVTVFETVLRDAKAGRITNVILITSGTRGLRHDIIFPEYPEEMIVPLELIKARLVQSCLDMHDMPDICDDLLAEESEAELAH